MVSGLPFSSSWFLGMAMRLWQRNETEVCVAAVSRGSPAYGLMWQPLSGCAAGAIGDFLQKPQWTRGQGPLHNAGQGILLSVPQFPICCGSGHVFLAPH